MLSFLYYLGHYIQLWPKNVLQIKQVPILYTLIISCGHVVRDFESEAKLAVTFNFDKKDIIDFMKFSKMAMCRASEANS